MGRGQGQEIIGQLSLQGNSPAYFRIVSKDSDNKHWYDLSLGKENSEHVIAVTKDENGFYGWITQDNLYKGSMPVYKSEACPSILEAVQAVVTKTLERSQDAELLYNELDWPTEDAIRKWIKKTSRRDPIFCYDESLLVV